MRSVIAIVLVCLIGASVAMGAAGKGSGKAPIARPAQKESVTLDGDKYVVQWLAREPFDKSWASRWATEGDCEVKAEGGKLWVKGVKVAKINSATIWFRKELPADLIVRFRAKVLPPKEENAANLNVIFNARELDSGPVIFGRSGVYGEYHEIPNYIITLTGGVQPGWSRVRRNPGFRMLHESDVRSEVGKQYQIVVTVQKGRIRYYVDGHKYHDVRDPSPLPGGRFAFRTWSTNAWWSDVQFGQVLSSK